MKFRLDGFLQAVLGGKSRARVTSVSAPFLYAQGGIFRRVVDLPADKALSGGFEIEGDADNLLASELDRLNVFETAAYALKLARLFGGACVIPLVADGKGLSRWTCRSLLKWWNCACLASIKLRWKVRCMAMLRKRILANPSFTAFHRARRSLWCMKAVCFRFMVSGCLKC